MVSAPLRDDALSSEQRWLCRASAAPSSLCLRLAALVSEVDVPWRDVVNPEASLDIWKVVRPLVPDTFEGCSLAGPHPQLRLLQYHGGTGEGDHPVHADTPLAAPDSYSRLTALVYVNSGFAGGSLRFLDGADGADVDPKEGTVVVFDHRLLHQARAVVSGTKQVVKMSVLYEAEPEAPLRQTLAGADLEVRWPFVLAERALARGARVASEALDPA